MLGLRRRAGFHLVGASRGSSLGCSSLWFLLLRSTGSGARGLPRWRLPSPRAQTQQLWRRGLGALLLLGSSQIWGQTHASCIGRQIRYH